MKSGIHKKAMFFFHLFIPESLTIHSTNFTKEILQCLAIPGTNDKLVIPGWYLPLTKKFVFIKSKITSNNTATI